MLVGCKNTRERMYDISYVGTHLSEDGLRELFTSRHSGTCNGTHASVAHLDPEFQAGLELFKIRLDRVTKVRLAKYF